ncbi:hypothetical protein VKT23_008582 [Stygiomarasmius scandens]|uniref:Uncharacterized protein n=1 Tax=Marasmiellus scandens TaxID=2682957 RepID=A0ABR1JGU9_9AGAR
MIRTLKILESALLPLALLPPNAHTPDQDVKGVTTSTSRIDVHENSASFRVDEFEFENDSNSDPAGSETGDTIESSEDVEDIQSASVTVFDDFDITSECGSSSSFSDCGFILSVQDEGLGSDSDETDSEAEMSESNPETDTIVISDDTQRHDDPLVRTLSTLVDDKELPGHGGIDDFDDDEEDAVEVEEVHKALVMDEIEAEYEQQLDRDGESPNVTNESSDSGPAGSNALATFSSSQDARISTLESAQSELTAELDEKNARISRLRSLLNETAAYRDKLEHDLALLQIQSTKQLADAREEAKQQKEEIEVRDERVRLWKESWWRLGSGWMSERRLMVRAR